MEIGDISYSTTRCNPKKRRWSAFAGDGPKVGLFHIQYYRGLRSVSEMTKAIRSIAALKEGFLKSRKFVESYWFNPDGKLSKSVTEILGYFENGKLTLVGRDAYRRLVNNLTK